jgi:hypothetical protein
VEAELVALAAAGATTLVQQMATDGWNRARDRVTAFLARRGSASADDLTARLDASRTDVTQALRSGDEDWAGGVRSEWMNQFRRHLRDHPEDAEELRALLGELDPDFARTQRGEVRNVISGGTQHGTVIQAGHVGEIRLGGTD